MGRDHYSSNGVVHIVDKVIMPATKSLKEMIETDVQFTALKSHLNSVGLMDKLRKAMVAARISYFTICCPMLSVLESSVAKLKQPISTTSISFWNEMLKMKSWSMKRLWLSIETLWLAMVSFISLMMF